MNKVCKHELVEFNTGKQPHLWACLKCKDYAPYPHPNLKKDEIKALILFAIACREEFFNNQKAPMVVQLTTQGGKMEITVQITARSKEEIPGKLKDALAEWEKEPGKKAKTKKTDTAAVEETLEASEEESEESLLNDEAEETTEESEDQMGFDDMEEEPAKGKGKKLTVTDVNNAAMAHAKKHTRKKTLEIFQKKFKVKSINELKADQYAAAIAALKV